MKKLFIGGGAVIVLVIVAALVVPFLIPAETYKGQLLTQVREATGREARIDGAFKFSILPRVEFAAGKVSFANAPGGKAAAMVSVDNLNVQVALFPLLGGKVEIDSFVLTKPVINLEIDKAGKPNWQFGAPAPAAAAPAQSQKTDGGAGGGGGGVGLSGLKLGDVRLVDGQVSYSDARTGVTHRLDGINLKVSLPSLSDPMKADGSLIWNKEKIDLTLGLSNPNGFLNGRKTDVETSIAAAPVKLSFKGSATSGKRIEAGGALDLDVPSLRKLASWVGAPLQAPGSGYGPLKISGQIEVKGQKYAFRQAAISIDQIKGTGEVAFDGGGRKPSITAKLRLGQLDLNPYLPPETAPGAQPGAQPGGQQTAVAAKAGPAEWSDDPIDLSGLRAADASLDLSVAGIVVRKIKIGQSDLTVRLKDGVLVTDLKKMALYGGAGGAKLTADGAGRVPRIALNFALKNFQANPFMSGAMDFNRIEGAANADLSVATQGSSQRALVAALGGRGKVTFLDGAIRGVNLAAMVRNISSAFLDPKAASTQKTDFTELGGTFVINRGIVTNNDLLLRSPLLRLSGKGTIGLPKRRVDYRIEPKLVATTEGQGATSSASGIKVPVIVSGPWDNVSYTPDLAGAIGGIAKDPKKALESLKGLIPGQSGDGGSKPKLPVDAEKLLKGLFGR
ncbi:MAG: AsmA family protein [Proteobacteria bacterium]|nr:AsmA family protein [Pseudomonadota bacterium]